uniref:ABC transporter ATP-binding protein n=1 Tax=Aminobacter niigataensis TaxID=83265 RepID=UPI002852936B|nr:ABC transporter ATP-binding protein [Aminobacter niigataensis]WMD00155.1 ABC transporter ATP-binding protein [Aminobacter niigataensis]
MTGDILKVNGVNAGYGRRQVLRNITFSVPEGAVVGIIGPNGHGKSTLMRAISGLNSISSGSIFLGGVAVHQLPAHQRAAQGLVHIPQGDLVFPEMTVEENLRLGAILAPGDDEVDRRLEQVYRAFARLLERRGQIAGSLSGGERRMLGIGRGLMTGGRIMLLDEPSLGLAPKIIDQIYANLATLRQISPTLVIVEENPTRLQTVAEYIYLMDNGEFVWRGRAEELDAAGTLLKTYLGT